MVSVLPENVSRKYQISNYFSEVYIIILTMLMHVCELSLSTLYMVSVKPTIIIYSNFSNMKVSMFDGLSLSEIANYKFLNNYINVQKERTLVVFSKTRA